MSVPLWVSELASAFWDDAGGEEPFPRQLLRPARLALPVDVVGLPGLRVRGVMAWLARRKIDLALAETDRPLRGCLVAAGGCGLAFLDSDDGPEERRFSLAHELAHFLRDYLQPRRRAEARLGSAARAVFDGERPARPEERLHALLGAVTLGFHTHLMARDPDGNPDGPAAASERDADRLAYELLAPAAAVLPRLRRARDPRAAAVPVLRRQFGLPDAEARRYAGVLLPAAPPADPLLRKLRGLSNFAEGGGK